MAQAKGDVNGKCKACKKTKDAMGNAMVWDPEKIVKAAEPDTKKGHLEASVSASDGLINLNIGDMVVDIKKLKKKSNFEISSPLGVGGIRG